MELEVLNAALAKHIRPATFPLAIRMVAPDEAFPERTERPKSDLGERIAICQGSALARHCGWAVGMTTEDVSCPLALAVWGLKPMLGYFLEGMTCAGMYTRTPAEGVVTEASVDKWEYSQWQGVVAAPLRRAAFDPHLVLLYGCSAQVMRLVTARLWSSGGRSSSSFAGRIDCADAVIATMKTGECQVILACYGDRVFGQALAKEAARGADARPLVPGKLIPHKHVERGGSPVAAPGSHWPGGLSRRGRFDRAGAARCRAEVAAPVGHGGGRPGPPCARAAARAG